MGSIKWKLVMIYLALVFIVMLVSGTFIIVRLEAIEMDKARVELLSFANRITSLVIDENEVDDYQDALDDFSRRYPDWSTFQGSILDSSGMTIASTTASEPPYPQYTDEIIIAALAGSSTYSSGQWGQDIFLGLLKEWLSYAHSVLNTEDGTVKNVVFVQLDIADIRENVSQIRYTIVTAVILALFLTSIIGFAFAATITGPITALITKSRDIARGRQYNELEVKSEDEIGQLTRSFNNMAKELNASFATLDSEKSKLEIVLHRMSDGVLAFDHYGRLLHANTASYELLEIKANEMTYEAVAELFKVDREALLAMRPDDTMQAGCRIKSKYINSYIAAYSNSGMETDGIIIVLHDITEMKKLDDMRREFVANLSHELRTPLTTIKSYTETLLDGAMYEPEALEFLCIIDGEADKMTVLVKDLLQISRMDNRKMVLSPVNVDLNEIISNNIRQNKIHADQKEQEIRFTKHYEPMPAYVDPYRIGQVISNILMNAVRYSPKNATIQIYTDKTDTHYKIYIKDNGIGIPPEDLSRIFERFYRVDKARSRAMGGTGLGLSIAKQIVTMHSGNITVESEPGNGTTMTIWLPVT